MFGSEHKTRRGAHVGWHPPTQLTWDWVPRGMRIHYFVGLHMGTGTRSVHGWGMTLDQRSLADEKDRTFEDLPGVAWVLV